MNHYPHHIGDFNSATRHLTPVERALYRELLDVYYDSERALNADMNRLARRVLAHTETERAALQSVLEEFFVLQDDGWHNARCDREIAAYHQKQEQQSKAGKASAAKRRRKPTGQGGGGDVSADGGGIGSTPVQRPFNERTTNQNQNQNHIKETSSPKADDGATLVQPAVQQAGNAVPKSEGEWAVLFGTEFGVEVDHTDLQDRKKFWPKAKAWVSAGVTLGQMRAAVAKARDEATEGIAYLPAYVDRVLATMSAPPPESRTEAAARARMQQAAPLAAAQAPSHGTPAAMADGYQFFKDQAAGARVLLPMVEVSHA